MTKHRAGFNVACFDTSRDTRQSEQMHDTFNTTLRTLPVCLLLLTIAACSSRGGGGNEASAESSEAWFCQIDETGEGWDCVRDDELARSPVPRRLPTPAGVEPAVAPVIEPVVAVTSPEPAEDPELTTDSAQVENPAPAPAENIAGEYGATAVAVAATVEEAPQPITSPTPPEQPRHLSLAYQTGTQKELTELPADLFVVQLVAMDSYEKLASFRDVNELNDLTAVRVEKDGELFYVLILGVYGSEAIARDASAELPDALAGTQPWIRKLGSLQTAMIRADNLATSDEF